MTTPGFDRQKFMQTGRAAAAGYFIIFAIGLPTGVGYWVDGRWGTQPWGMLVGLLVGVAAAGRELYVIAKTTKFGQSQDDPPPDDRGAPSP